MWLLLKDTDGDFSIVWAESVSMITQRLGHKLGRVTYNPDAGVPETFTDVTEIAVHYNLDVAIRKMAESCNPPEDATKNVRACRVCGCTDEDCSQCIDETGGPCNWVEADLCSACVVVDALIAEIDKGEGEPESPYARVLRTKVCPHCSADIGDNIFDCPVCDKPLGHVTDSVPRLHVEAET